MAGFKCERWDPHTFIGRGSRWQVVQREYHFSRHLVRGEVTEYRPNGPRFFLLVRSGAMRRRCEASGRVRACAIATVPAQAREDIKRV